MKNDNSWVGTPFSERVPDAKKFAEIVFETIQESLVVLDSSLTVVTANNSFYEIFHVLPGETIGRFIYDLGNGQWNIPRLRTLLEEILPKKNTFDNFELEHDFESIGHKTMLLNARRIDDMGLILLAIEDISSMKHADVERKAAKQTMTESEEKYRNIFTSSRDAIMTLEPPTWKFTSANPATISMFGAKNEKEFLSYQPWKLSPEFQPDGKKSIDKAKEIIDKAMKEGSNFFEWTHQKLDGEFFSADVLLSKIELNKKVFLQGVVRDITKRKRMEKLLEEKLRLAASNTMFQQVIEAIPARIFWKDKNLTYLGCNTLFARDAGKKSPDELIGRNDYEMGWKNEAELYRSDDAKVIELKQPKINYEEPQTTPDGKHIWLRTSKIPLRDSKGLIMGILGTYEDVTGRKNMEEALRISEEKYRTLIERMNDGVFIIQDEILKFINSGFASIAGYTVEEVIGKKFIDYIAPPYKDIVVKRYKERQKGTHLPKDYEIQVLNKNGKPIDVLISVGIITYEGKVASMGILKDISERKKAEREVHALSTRQKAILSAIPDIIMEVNTDKVYTWANKPGFDFFGNDVIGNSADFYFEGEQEVFTTVQPLFEGSEDTTYVESWQRRRDGEKRLLAWRCRALKDEKGNVTGVLSSARDITLHKEMEEKIIEDKSKDEAILDSIGDAVFACDINGRIVLFNNMAEILSKIQTKNALHRHYSEILSFVKENDETPSDDFIQDAIKKNMITKMSNHTLLLRKDGTKIPVSDSAAPIKNAAGQIIGCVVVFHDVTKEREIDKAKTEFVSLASHQLRTPLTTINWYSELLQSSVNGTLNEKQREYTSEINNAGKRMVNLVNALLNTSRLELGTFSVEPENVNLIEITRSCINALLPQITTKKIMINETFDISDSSYQADSKLLSIILDNIISNAIKYSPTGSTVVVGMKRDTEGILISVSDSGVGIPDHEKNKMFSKLFRAENAQAIDPNGSGLGLYMVREILKAVGGNIWFESTEGKGTTFYIRLPEKGMTKKGGMRKLI